MSWLDPAWNHGIERIKRDSFSFGWYNLKIFGPLIALLTFCVVSLSTTVQAQESFENPDVLVLGDSQLSFGAGVAFVEFFKKYGSSCGLPKSASVGVIGVRSSQLVAWTARDAVGKKSICDVDPKWKVNAGSFGVINKTNNKYVQIGQGAAYQFCKPNQSPFQAMFSQGYYNPKLLVMFILGNATERWANSEAEALNDVRRTMKDLPSDLPCVFMTTAPAYTEKVVLQRKQAQDNIEKAFKTVGKSCSFVRGYTDRTIAANLGNPNNFRRKPDGSVKDPYHPTEDSARQFLSLVKDDFCSAIKTQLK
jgi:hypothetical protein